MTKPRDIRRAIDRLARNFPPLRNVLNYQPPPPAVNDNTPPVPAGKTPEYLRYLLRTGQYVEPAWDKILNDPPAPAANNNDPPAEQEEA